MGDRTRVTFIPSVRSVLASGPLLGAPLLAAVASPSAAGEAGGTLTIIRTDGERFDRRTASIGAFPIRTIARDIAYAFTSMPRSTRASFGRSAESRRGDSP